MAGLIIPTDVLRLCKGALAEAVKTAFDITLTNASPQLKSTFGNFQSLTIPVSHSYDDQLLYTTFGLDKSILHADTWCSRYNQAA